ncbi:family 20 glycosylhydrolase [Photobacterium lutimaris]|uniref:beta-N-acetylhexosaminidase n=1 Tax=Photobacterium lutimaris TaxID=388278 RepID=A0A2T3IYL6_9GAMM|nr:family 20 glycosylhydrolase [Photobacterium lutimaris]PSU33673.1 beta-N-acetylglucosaminidase [Photobacterium lutimaris]TDR74473.1 hexosaminidase [Photobacterium lutimaris]
MIRKTLLSVALAAACSVPAYAISVDDISQLGNGLQVTYGVLDNTQDDWRTFRGEISFTNTSAKELPASGWAIYFSHIRMMKTLATPALKVTHINGDIFKLEPTAHFTPLKPGDTFHFEFDAGDWQVAKTDVMPNWYLVSEDAGQEVTALIASTSNKINGKVPVKPSEELPFVADFDSPEKWKRYGSNLITDYYDPFTAQNRFARNADLSVVENIRGVIPTPASITIGTDQVSLDSSWVVVFDNGYEEQAQYLANQLGLSTAAWSPQTQKIIHIGWGQIAIDGNNKWAEAYQLDVDSAAEIISIKAVDEAGAFYAAQTLLQLKDGQAIPAASVVDAPRFAYRGLSVDSSRNFRSKDSILQLLEQMATFKLNKLHLRLADDEGWRIEIAELPELTEVGANRCHDLTGTQCILPFLGAGPDGTTESNGYYTAQDYKEILRYANDLNIEVIPELDMPGHAHAAIKAMEARYTNLMAHGDIAGAEQYLLTDLEDKSDYLSVQMFKDNAMNVCMDSTYRFVDTVVANLVSLHQDIQPLKKFHFGGDEIAGAWKDSPICQDFIANNSDGINSVADLSRYFVERISTITANYDLNLGGWEDGLMNEGKVYPRAQLANTKVSGNAWQNIWEWGVADRAYNLANNGFDVVYNQASHMYFDHPYEPDPNERGYYWAPRFTDTRKTFGFMPDDLYANADFTRAGAPITKEQVIDAASVKSLTRPEKVIGLQGSLWAETVRTEEQFEGMVFPRLLGVAERAWHRAPWEADDLAKVVVDEEARKADYNHFANLVAQKVFPKMEAAGIAFNLPVPGATIKSGLLQVNSPFPGLAVEYSTDNGNSWTVVDLQAPPTVTSGVKVRSVSGERTSRVTTVR